MRDAGRDPVPGWLITPVSAFVLVLAIVGVGYLMRTSQPAATATATPPTTGATAQTVASAPAPTATLPALASQAPTPAVASVATPLPSPPPGPQATPHAAAAVGTTPQAAAPAREARPVRLEAAITAGKALCNVVAQENGQTIYATDDGPEQLLAVDVMTRRVTKTFDLKDSLCSLALDAAGTTAYIPTWRRKASGGFDSSEFQVVHLGTGTISRFPATLFPTGPFLDPASHVLYAANTATPTLVAINTATGQVTDSIAIPAKANRMTTSTANGDLYVASPDANKVYVLDRASHQVVATLDAGSRPWDVAADPKTGRVFVSGELSGTVTILDPQYNETVRAIKVGNHPRNLAIDAMHGVVYALNAGDHTVSSFDTNGDALQTSTALPGTDDVTGLAVAPETGDVFVVSKQQIYVLG